LPTGGDVAVVQDQGLELATVLDRPLAGVLAKRCTALIPGECDRGVLVLHVVAIADEADTLANRTSSDRLDGRGLEGIGAERAEPLSDPGLQVIDLLLEITVVGGGDGLVAALLGDSGDLRVERFVDLQAGQRPVPSDDLLLGAFTRLAPLTTGVASGGTADRSTARQEKCSAEGRRRGQVLPTGDVHCSPFHPPPSADSKIQAFLDGNGRYFRGLQ